MTRGDLVSAGLQADQVQAVPAGYLGQLTGADRHAWDCLVEQWGGAYEFEYQPGTENLYACKRRDDGLQLAASTVESLHDLVQEDYHERPVPRSVAP